MRQRNVKRNGQRRIHSLKHMPCMVRQTRSAQAPEPPSPAPVPTSAVPPLPKSAHPARRDRQLLGGGCRGREALPGSPAPPRRERPKGRTRARAHTHPRARRKCRHCRRDCVRRKARHEGERGALHTETTRGAQHTRLPEKGTLSTHTRLAEPDAKRGPSCLRRHQHSKPPSSPTSTEKRTLTASMHKYNGSGIFQWERGAQSGAQRRGSLPEG